MAKDKVRIILTGGGSGGHIYPLSAVTEELQKTAIDNKLLMEIRYFGPKDEYSEILKKEGIAISRIAGGKLRRYFSLLNILDVPKFFIGLVQACFKIFWFMPDVIFSKGGTGSLAVVFAGWFYRIPVIIHESDAHPGLNNLLSSPFAKRIALSFESARPYFNPSKTLMSGTPLRDELLKDLPAKETAREELGFNSEQPLILILCGSQGSKRINEFIISVLKDLIKETQILHQTGKANYNEAEKLSRAALVDVPLQTEIKNRYQAASYLDLDPYSKNNLKKALEAADLVVARAGSNTIFELAAFAKPAVLIPLAESANDHQRLNAYEFAKTGAAEVIEEENLLPGVFLSQIKELLGHPDFLKKMSEASLKFFKPEAAKVLADEVLKLAT